MNNITEIDNSDFTTQRLNIFSINHSNKYLGNKSRIEEACLRILTKNVVKSLPAYFSGINNIEKAEQWLSKMTAKSHFLLIQELTSKQIIGFMFLYVENQSANIGYLLQESSWGQGYAKEFLTGLISWNQRHLYFGSLVGGVDIDNRASIALLKKVGFAQKVNPSHNNTLFFEYKF